MASNICSEGAFLRTAKNSRNSWRSLASIRVPKFVKATHLGGLCPDPVVRAVEVVRTVGYPAWPFQTGHGGPLGGFHDHFQFRSEACGQLQERGRGWASCLDTQNQAS